MDKNNVLPYKKDIKIRPERNVLLLENERL